MLKNELLLQYLA